MESTVKLVLGYIYYDVSEQMINKAVAGIPYGIKSLAEKWGWDDTLVVEAVYSWLSFNYDV